MKLPRLTLMGARILAVLLLVAGAWVIYAVYGFGAHLAPRGFVQRTSAAGLPDFVEIARRFDPALVHISTRTTAMPPANGGSDGSFAVSPVPHAGLGSGVIVRSDGHILTNDHVVANAEEMFVKLADRRELRATVVGRDPRSDLALIKVAAPARLAAAPLGNSSMVQTGEWVVALGSPFGLDRTLTAGIVSAKARRLATSVYADYIQTDVTINPGNSGGPLLNLQGLVVGINTAILSRDGNNTGINFAIPINLVKELLPELFSKGRVARGWLGISTQTMSRAAARQLRLDGADGALVVGVAPEGPAARAGIRPGDVVVAYDGKAIVEAAELPALVAKTSIGRRVTLYINRHRILHRAVLAVSELKEPVPASVAETSPAVMLHRGAEFQS